MKILKKIILAFFVILLLLNVLIFATGKQYLYKGLKYTYLKGKSGPSIDEFESFPIRIVANDPNNIQAWQNHSTKANFSLSNEEIATLNQFKTTAFLIIHQDSIVIEEYYEGSDMYSISNSFSAAKSIVGALIGAAIKDGYIKSVKQSVKDFIPELINETPYDLTIEHLLTMSSGINFDEDYVSPFAYPAESYYGEDVEGLTLKYKVVEEPGKVNKYLSGNSEILGIIIKRATKMTVSDYAAEKLWKTVGAEQIAKWNLDVEDGTEKAFCCFNSSARDFARIGKLYLNYGNWNGVQIIDSSYVAASVEPASYLKNEEGNNIDYYGYHWWMLNHKGYEVFCARGILGQYIFCIPQLDVVAVRLGHQRMKTQTNHHPDDVFLYLDIIIGKFI
jgi:CubicO group peptidase (beta-lactamase class C family)